MASKLSFTVFLCLCDLVRIGRGLNQVPQLICCMTTIQPIADITVIRKIRKSEELRL